MRALVGAQLVVAAGAMTVASGVATLTDSRNAAVLVAIVLGIAAIAHATHLLRLRVAAVATGVVAGLWWLTLVGLGIERLGYQPTLAGVWADLGGWPLLAAAALAAAPALLRSLPLPVRVAGASIGVTPAHRRRGGAGRGRVHPDPGPRRPRRRRRRRRPLAGHLRRLALAPGRPDRRRRPRAHRPGRWSSAARPSRPSSTTGSGRSAPGSTCSPPLSPAYWALLLPVMVAAALVACAVLARPVLDLPAPPAAAVLGTAVLLAVAVVPGMYDVPLWSALAVQAGVLGVLALGAVALGRTVAAAVLGVGAALLAPLVLATALANDWLTAVTLLAGTVGALAAAYLGRGPSGWSATRCWCPSPAGSPGPSCTSPTATSSGGRCRCCCSPAAWRSPGRCSSARSPRR